MTRRSPARRIIQDGRLIGTEWFWTTDVLLILAAGLRTRLAKRSSSSTLEKVADCTMLTLTRGGEHAFTAAGEASRLPIMLLRGCGRTQQHLTRLSSTKRPVLVMGFEAAAAEEVRQGKVSCSRKGTLPL